MELTARYGLPLLVAGQGQKEVTHNEALLLLDAAVGCVVERRDLVQPPNSPIAGQCWLVPSGAGLDWDGKAGQIATWTEGGWRYLSLPEGATLYDKAGGQRLRRMGESWQADGLSGAPLAQISSPSGGVTVDSEVRAVVNAILERMRTLGLIQS